MNTKNKSLILWIIAVVLTLIIVIYQRATGPTYPRKGKINIADTEIKYKLITSAENTKNGIPKNAVVKIKNAAKIFGGSIVYKKYKTFEEWQEVRMVQNGDYLEGELPSQPMAGKLEYRVFLKYGNDNYALNMEPVVIRFTGEVPKYILIPHILLMFIAMLFSTRTGIEALTKGNKTFLYTIITVITLFFGGIILGPIVQKYAFGALWTGWPFGKDLTDNKTLVAFIFWVIALFVLYKNRDKKTMAIIAMIVLLAVYLIPHSMFGSELDYNSGKITTSQDL